MLYADAEDLEDLFEPPDAFTDPMRAIEISKGKLQDARINNAPPERLDLLMRYITECQKLQKQAEAEIMAQQQAMMQPPMPPGMPGPAGPAMGDVNISPEFNMPEPPMNIPGM